MNQKELEYFREELQSKMSNTFNVIVKPRKLPMSLLIDNKKVKVLTLLNSHLSKVLKVSIFDWFW